MSYEFDRYCATIVTRHTISFVIRMPANSKMVMIANVEGEEGDMVIVSEERSIERAKEKTIMIQQS